MAFADSYSMPDGSTSLRRDKFARPVLACSPKMTSSFFLQTGGDFDIGCRFAARASHCAVPICCSLSTTSTVPLPSPVGLHGLHRHGQDVAAECSGISTEAYMPGHKLVFGIGNINFGVHGAGVHVDLIGETHDFPMERSG